MYSCYQQKIKPLLGDCGASNVLTPRQANKTASRNFIDLNSQDTLREASVRAFTKPGKSPLNP
jgi:hypothetical protein